MTKSSFDKWLQVESVTFPRTHCVSQTPPFVRLASRFQNLINDCGKKSALKFWAEHELADAESGVRWLYERIVNGTPTCVGRIGGVEANVAMWANMIGPRLSLVGSIPTGYWQTHSAATNAGVKPRNRASYKAFGKLIWQAMSQLDMIGVWRTWYEAEFLQRTSLPILVDGEALSPSFEFQHDWVGALHKKKVLVVSPFVDSFVSQNARLSRVWPTRKLAPSFEIIPIKFPYLIEDDCSLLWWDVYESVATVLKKGDYDIALFGCGGLGLPLAALACSVGKIGFHLGGHLQLLFGVYGYRHLHQDWHSRWINEFWVRPAENEVPRCAKRVEGGCYW